MKFFNFIKSYIKNPLLNKEEELTPLFNSNDNLFPLLPSLENNTHEALFTSQVANNNFNANRHTTQLITNSPPSTEVVEHVETSPQETPLTIVQNKILDIMNARATEASAQNSTPNDPAFAHYQTEIDKLWDSYYAAYPREDKAIIEIPYTTHDETNLIETEIAIEDHGFLPVITDSVANNPPSTEVVEHVETSPQETPLTIVQNKILDIMNARATEASAQNSTPNDPAFAHYQADIDELWDSYHAAYPREDEAIIEIPYEHYEENNLKETIDVGEHSGFLPVMFDDSLSGQNSNAISSELHVTIALYNLDIPYTTVPSSLGSLLTDMYSNNISNSADNVDWFM